MLFLLKLWVFLDKGIATILGLVELLLFGIICIGRLVFYFTLQNSLLLVCSVS